MEPHLHKLTLLDVAPYPTHHSYVCNLCCERGHGPVYHCSDCNFDLHQSCAATLDVQDHFSHREHLLHRCHTNHNLCDSCGLNVHRVSYRCPECDFDLHPTCARAPRFIMHPSHDRHPLQLTWFPNGTTIPCEACKLPIHHLCYACTVCNKHYFHQFCASLSNRILHPDHPIHPLMLITHDRTSKHLRQHQCSRCKQNIVAMGSHYHCEACNFSLHPGCLNIVHEIPEYSPTSSTTVTHQHAVHSNDPTRISTHNITNPSQEPSSSTYGSMQFQVRLHDDVLQGLNVPSERDIEVAENVLRFARVLTVSMSTATNNSTPHIDNESDVCPTCLEGNLLNSTFISTSYYIQVFCLLLHWCLT